MVTIAFASGKGSPGVTTTVLALAMVWREVHPDRTALVIDADPGGSGITMGFLQGRVDATCGVVPLAARRPASAVSAMWAELVALDQDGGALLLPGIPDASLRDAVDHAWSTVVAALTELRRLAPDVDVLIDLGRCRSGDAPLQLLDGADRAVVLTEARLRYVPAARGTVRTVSDHVPSVSCAIVGGATHYSPTEIESALDAPVLAVLPHDPGAAAVLSDGDPPGWRFKRSPLLRSARAMAASLLSTEPQPVAPESMEPADA